MPAIRADGIAVYVYRKVTRAGKKPAYEFLQILRSAEADGFEHSWQTVYGGVKKKETAVEAALRELLEETGLKPVRMFQVEFLETFYFRPKDYVLVMPVFGVEVSAEAKIRLNEEHTDFRWIAEQEIEEAFMWRTQREALGHVVEQLRGRSGAAGFLELDVQAGRHRGKKKRR